MSLETIRCRIFQAGFNIGARMLPWRKAKLISATGAIRRIPELLQTEKVERVLLVTGPRLVKTEGVGRVLTSLSAAGIPYELYSDVESNPSIATVNAIAERYHAAGCDSFLAIGGGSPMDAAKAAAARVVQPAKSVKQLGGLLKVRKRIPPFIAVPTTAGTGSETTVVAVINNTTIRHKYAIMDPQIVPHYALLDPTLTLDLPPDITAATGMDALTHAIEAYLCWTYNTAESKRFALEATEAIFAHLEKVYLDGSDLEGRLALLVASYKAGFAFTRAGVGNVHAIAHTLGGLYNTPHGLANAVILPFVLEDYGPTVQGKLSRLACAAGIADPTASDEVNAQRLITEIRAMNERMGIPTGFDFIRDEDIDQMVTWALEEANPLYPVPVIYDRARCRALIEQLRS